MSCCDENLASVPKGVNSKELTSSKDLAVPDVSRRTVLKGVAGVAGAIASAGPAAAQATLKPVKLAYCSQILCGVPYEVARSAGYWKKQGLDVELIYTRGGSAAMQARLRCPHRGLLVSMVRIYFSPLVCQPLAKVQQDPILTMDTQKKLQQGTRKIPLPDHAGIKRTP